MKRKIKKIILFILLGLFGFIIIAIGIFYISLWIKYPNIFKTPEKIVFENLAEFPNSKKWEFNNISFEYPFTCFFNYRFFHLSFSIKREGTQ